MHRSLNKEVDDKATITAYEKAISDLPDTKTGRGIVKKRLFVNCTVFAGVQSSNTLGTGSLA